VNYFVIGDEHTVLGFGLVGVNGQVATKEQDAHDLFNRAIGDRETAVVIITERVAEMIRPLVDRYVFTEEFPLILEIPDREGPVPDRPSLREIANTAIGIKV
jgi:V/A-type H+-transporting ATPase subunit F